MLVDQLMKRPSAWLSTRSSKSGVVISSRIRLARNIHGVAFPGWAGGDECKRIYDRLCDALCALPALEDAVAVHVHELSPVEREVLRERRLISSDLVEKGPGSGVVVSQKHRVAIMINEEDHLRLQVMRPGLDLASAWRVLDRLDSALEEQIIYAFSPELGYLTACPSNVGTGLRVSVMLHLPGLKLLDEIDPVIKGLNRMGLAVRGAFGEGSDAFGNMYQISNQTTLGINEKETVAHVQDVVETLVTLEENARARLMEQRELHLLDFVNRALGILKYAQIISSGEALDLLSGLRLGLEFGILSGVGIGRLNELMLVTQPGHLQKAAKHLLAVDERDAMRARLIRKKLNGIELTRHYE
jgi:protein arginine kinase